MNLLIILIVSEFLIDNIHAKIVKSTFADPGLVISLSNLFLKITFLCIGSCLIKLKISINSLSNLCSIIESLKNLPNIDFDILYLSVSNYKGTKFKVIGDKGYTVSIKVLSTLLKIKTPITSTAIANTVQYSN